MHVELAKAIKLRNRVGRNMIIIKGILHLYCLADFDLLSFFLLKPLATTAAFRFVDVCYHDTLLAEEAIVVGNRCLKGFFL